MRRRALTDALPRETLGQTISLVSALVRVRVGVVMSASRRNDVLVETPSMDMEKIVSCYTVVSITNLS